MTTVNERMQDEVIRHAVALHLYSNGATRKVLALLNRAAVSIGSELLAALARLPPQSFTVERLDALLARVKELNVAAYERVNEFVQREMGDLTRYEIGHQAELFQAVIPPQVIIALPLVAVNPEQVHAAAMARPFQGALLREWAARQEVQSMQRIRDTVRQGYVAQETISQIVTRVRGTRAAGYADGILAIDRRNAEAVVRTAVSHTAGYARDAYHAANAAYVGELQWLSTLDSRTSEPCILRDGKVYGAEDHAPHGHSLPWGAGPGRFHWNCRSVSLPVVRSFKSLGIDLPELEVETRASMDGQVPSKTTYGEWLLKQSAAIQDDVLGPERGLLMRKGGMSVEKFANQRGRWLTLDELRARDAKSFSKAGL